MFEDLPLFRITAKVLKFWGFILDSSSWRRYYCLLSCITLNMGQLVDILITQQSFDAVARDAYILVLWYSALLRTTVIIINRLKCEAFMDEIKDVYREIEKNECLEIREMLEKTSKSARSLATLNTAIGTSVSLGLVIFPIFASTRVLPYGFYVPGVDKYETPWYQIVYAFQLIITPVGNGMYLPFTNLIVTFMMFGVCRCKVLQHHLMNLKNLKTEEVAGEVTWCIRYHIEIMRYVETINSLTSHVFLVEFVATGALLCSLMFLLNMVNTLGEFVIVCFYFTMILSQSLCVYWFANELSVESSKIAEAAFDSGWFNFDLKTEKAVIMLIKQSQKPCEILVGNIYPMTLQMFQSLLNTSYSYFTLLRRVYN